MERRENRKKETMAITDKSPSKNFVPIAWINDNPKKWREREQ